MVRLLRELADTRARQLSLPAAYILGAWVSAISTIYSFVTGVGNHPNLAEGRYAAEGFNANELGIIFALPYLESWPGGLRS
jgi:hypothetical protein